MVIHDPALLKLGRKPKKLNMHTPRMASYLRSTVLPKIPSECLYGQGVSNWGMMLNDREGDCTAAGIGHAFKLWNAQWARDVTIPDYDVEKLYIAVTGLEGAAFNPNTFENDNGCVENDVLTYVHKNGFAGLTLDAFAYVSPKDIQLLKATIWLFGCAYVGVDLPITAQNQTEWELTDLALRGDAAPGSWGGHCILLIGYNDADQTFTCVTWGQTKKLAYDWWTSYGVEAWGLLSPGWLGDKGVSPTYLDLASLLDNMKLI